MLWTLLSKPPPQSPDFFSSPVWQFLSGIGAIIAIPIAIVAAIVAILAYHNQQRRKELTYQIISDAAIVSINPAVKDKIQILFMGNPAEDARLLVLKIWNSGNTALRDDDYFHPLSFEFKHGKVISGDILKTKPANILEENNAKTFLQLEPSSVMLPKFPLNPNDTLEISILVSGDSEMDTKGRISEGKIIKFDPLLNRRKYVKRRNIFTSIVFISFVIITISSAFFSHGSFIYNYLIFPFSIIIALLLVFLIYYIMRFGIFTQ